MRDTRRWCGSPGAAPPGQAPAHRRSPARSPTERSPPPASPPGLPGQPGGSAAAVGEGSPRREGWGAHGRAPPARKRDRFLLRGSDTLRPPLKQMMSGWVMVHSGKPSPIHTLECTTGSARPAPAIHSWHQNRSRNSKPEFRSPRFPSLISPNTARSCQGAKLK